MRHPLFHPRPAKRRRFSAAALACAAVIACTCAKAAGLSVDREPDRLVVRDDDGRTAVVFTFADPAVGRPALRDLHAPGGVLITRPCPPRPGIDADDHEKVHPGVMLCFSDLSGADPWRGKAAVRFGGFLGEPAAADGEVRFTFAADYLAEPQDTPQAIIVCHEQSTVTIADRTIDGRPVRVVTWDARLTPGDRAATFADVEEMGFGIRLLKELSPRWGGRYLASHGGRNEKGIFGQQADWCDASGTVDGAAVGVLLVDRGGPQRRALWHSRDYGWLLANPFGRRAYGKAESGAVTVAPGESLDLHYALAAHGSVPDSALDGLATAVEAGPVEPLP